MARKKKEETETTKATKKSTVKKTDVAAAKIETRKTHAAASKIETKKMDAKKISTAKDMQAKLETRKAEMVFQMDTEKEDAKGGKICKPKILFVAPEAQPAIASGGLGEVMGSLPAALQRNGHMDVSVVIPLYREVSAQCREKMKFVKHFNVQLAWRNQYCGIFKMDLHGVTYYFIDNEYYFNRDGLYGYYDDGERFAFFSRAVMEMMPQLDYYPDIVHVNDWQAALVPVYNTSIYHYGFKSIFTIHNVAYQGKFDLGIMGDVFGLSPEAGAYLEFNGCANLMKGAIECSNVVTTVSESYAEELMDPYYAEGLDAIIRRNSFKMHGILNGIETEVYDPATDPDLPANFTAKDLTGKRENKRNLQHICGLPEKPDTPVIAIISRLVHQKGIHLVQEVMENILREDVQIIILGVGENGYENYFKWIDHEYPEKVSANITFDNPLSHQIYAGADMLLMPSLTEPCGLSQMIASRYGTVPIVQETGGLRDSIRDCSYGEGNGFTFAGGVASRLEDAVKRALATYRRKDDWDALRKYIMTIDFSWSHSAEKYEDLYRGLVSF